MANAGFNAATDLFGLGANWKVKTSSINASASTAECPDSAGDTTHRDVYADKIAPTAEYVIVGDVSSLPALGTVVTVSTKKVMLTQLVVKTSKGAAATLTASGVQVESGASTRRTYSCGTVAISARHLAQDILGIHGATTPSTITESTFTFSVEPSFADPKGTVEASDCSNGKVVAEFTHTSGTGAAITPPSVSGTAKVVSDPASPTSPENDYVTTGYSITDSLTGSEPSS